MKFKLLLTFVFLFALAASPAMGQDQGEPDTIDMVITVQPDEASAAFDVQLQLWVFNDGDTINGASMGFGWDNPKLQMTSAVAESGSDGFLTKLLYDADNIDSTNLRQRFQFVGIRLFTPGVHPSPTPLHWATYNFSVAPDWVNSDVVHLDTFTYGSGQNYKLVSALGYDYFPYWTGPLDIVDANPASPSMLALSDDTLEFTGVVNGDNPGMQTFTVSEADAGAIPFTATESADWLSLGGVPGTTPGDVQVTPDISGMTSGTYTTNITVSSDEADNSPLSVFVRLVLAPEPELVVPPDTLYYTAVENGDNPVMRNFNVSELYDGVISYNATVTMGNTWITLGNASGNTPADVEVNVDITGVAAGAYDGAIQVASDTAANSPQMVYVHLDITPQPALSISEDTLYFTAVADGGNPPMQTFNVAEADGAVIPYSAGVTIGDTWITLGNAAGMTPADVEVNVNITVVGEGTYYGAVEIVSDTASNTPQVVVIQLDISAQAVLLVPTDTLEFTAVENGDNPAMQTFLTAMSDDSEVAYEAGFISGNTWIFLGNAAGNTPADIEVNISIMGLTPDEYFDSVQVTAEAGNSPVYVYVKLMVAPQPMLLTSDTTLFFTGIEGGDDLGMQSFTVSEIYGGAIPYNAVVTDNVVMISMSNQVGTTPGDVEVYVNISGISAGTYYDTITITSDTASNSPLMVYIETMIEEPPCVIPVISDTLFSFTAVEGNPATSPMAQVFTVSSSIASDNFDFTLDFAMDSINDRVYFNVDEGGASLTPVGGTTPASVEVTIDPTNLTEGTYNFPFTVTSQYGNICEDFIYLWFIVSIEILPPPSADTLVVHNVGVSPGGQVAVPITFSNSCNLKAMETSLMWDSEYLHLDSVSFANSAVAYFDIHDVTIENNINTVSLHSDAGAQAYFPTSSEQNWADLYFSVSCDADEIVYPIYFTEFEQTPYAFFESDCGSGVETEVPITYEGSINVETKPFDFCGWVVEEGTGTSIPGATVNLFSGAMIDFNADPLMTTTTGGIGSFLFENVETLPFSLWAYKEGYYPKKVEGLDLINKGVMIELTPIKEFAFFPHPWFVYYYCETNTYYDGPLPVGSYVEARNADGLMVGQFLVDSAGLYGYMPVYQDDDETVEVEGMVPGDMVHFFVNGEEATTFDNVIYPQATNMPPYQSVLVCLEVGIVQVHTCDLFEGWNLISWDVNTDNDIETVFGPYMDMIEVIIGFEQGGLIYDPELLQFSTLDYVDHYSGYWVKVKEGENFTMEFTGSPVQENTPIRVTAGWNLVSYLPDYLLTTDEALSSLTDDDNLLVALGFDDSLRVFRPDWQFSTLVEMNSCFGYWVKVTNDDYLVYPGEGPVVPPIPESPKVKALASLASKDVTPSNIWVNLYSANLTLNGELVQAGATITAHSVTGDLVGSYTLDKDGEFGFMPVYGSNDGDGLKTGDVFRLRVDGEEVNETLVWSNMGDRIEVTQLSTSANNGTVLPENYSLNQNYPNPFNPSTNISFTMAKAGQAKIEIYNLLGRVVAVPYNGEAQAGTNEVIWNGTNTTGEKVASGIYFYRLTADNFTETKKMILLK